MTTLEEQIQEYRALQQQIAALEEKKRELNQAISQQMSGVKMTVAGCVLRRYERLFFKTPIEKARELGATKTEEVLDKEVLKKLYEAGQPVPGVTCSMYLQISAEKKELVVDTETGEILR